MRLVASSMFEHARILRGVMLRAWVLEIK